MRAVYCAIAVILTSSTALRAADASPVDLTDNMHAVLERQSGKVVEVRLKNGDKISGKVADVGDKLLHISQITGQEFFDAFIDVKDVTAVIYKAREK
jgi:hypothetical protein